MKKVLFPSVALIALLGNAKMVSVEAGGTESDGVTVSSTVDSSYTITIPAEINAETQPSEQPVERELTTFEVGAHGVSIPNGLFVEVSVQADEQYQVNSKNALINKTGHHMGFYFQRLLDEEYGLESSTNVGNNDSRWTVARFHPTSNPLHTSSALVRMMTSDVLVHSGTYNSTLVFDIELLGSYEHVERVETPYTDILTIDVDTLPEGEVQVIQEPRPRIEDITYEIKHTTGGNVSETEIGRDLVQTGRNEIREVGTGIISIETEHVDNHTPFTDITYVETDQLPEGEENVIQPSRDEIERVTYSVTYKDGVEVDREETGRTITQTGLNEIREIGTGIITTDTDVVQNVTTFNGVDYIETDQLAEGVERVVHNSRNEIEEVVYNVTFKDGNEIEREEIRRDITQIGRNELREVGTGIITTDTEVINNVTPITHVEYVETDQLPEGEVETIREAQDEIERVTYELTLKDGNEIDRIETDRRITQEGLHEIREIGTGIITTGTDYTDNVTVFNTVDYVDTDQLPEGEERVIQQSRNEIERVTYSVTFKDGNEINRTETNREITQSGRNEIREVGTGIITTDTDIVENRTQFNTVEYVDTNQLPEGEERVIQSSRDEIERITYSVTYRDGNEISRTETDRRITQTGRNEIREVGTGIITTGTDYSENVTRFTNVEYVNTDQLAEGEERVIQTARDEIERIDYSVTYRDGVEISRTETGRTITQSGRNEIREVGTGIITTGTVSETETTPYNNTIYVDEPTWYVSQTEVIESSRPQIQSVTYTVTYKDGVEVSRTESGRTTTQSGRHERVRRGTIVPTSQSHFTWTSNGSGTVAITGYSDSGPRDIIVPREINGNTVTEIGENAFRINRMTWNEETWEEYRETEWLDNAPNSVRLPDTIKTIGMNAFVSEYDWATDSFIGYDGDFILPDSVEYIGHMAFENTGITVDIPANLEYVGYAAFNGTRLGNITLPNSLTYVEESGFVDAGITGHLTIPNSLTEIKENAFGANYDVTGLTIPSTVRFIDFGAFTGTPVPNVTLHANTEYYEWSFDWETTVNGGTEIPDPYAW